MVTQKDIAEKAGVARSTVAIALGNVYSKSGARVSEAKRAHIKKVAKEMGYAVDDMARSIKTGKSKVIGYASTTPNSAYTGLFADSMSQAAAAHGYMIKLINGYHMQDKYREVINICLSNRLSALIVHGMGNPDILDELKYTFDRHGIELAFVSNTRYVPSGCLWVSSNEEKGVREAVRYLYDLEHRDFMMVTPPPIASYPFPRIRAFFETLAELNINEPGKIEGGTSEMKQSLNAVFSDKDRRPSALVCSSDYMALFAKTYLEYEFGIKTPDDISIVGFGDFRLAQSCYPTLTTIYEPFAEMGSLIIEKLIARIEGRDFGSLEEFVDTKLIVRESTGKPQK